MLEGGCQCGEVRYRVSGDPAHHALCHCRDCRASSGAPATAWMAFPAENFNVIKGKAVSYNSSGASYGRQHLASTSYGCQTSATASASKQICLSLDATFPSAT